MQFDARSFISLLDRIEHHPRLEILCYEFDSAIARAFRQDVRSLAWMLHSSPDLMTADQLGQALTNLRNRYLVVPSEFRDLIEDAIVKTHSVPPAPGESRSIAGMSPTDGDLAGTG